MPFLVSENFIGVSAPANLPPAVIAKLHAAIQASLDDPTFMARMHDLGLTVQKMSQPEFVDAGESVLANGMYTDTLPCLPDEGRLQGCVNGRIRVSAPDGVHFANDGSGYSAGGRRFADAIDEAVTGLR